MVAVILDAMGRDEEVPCRGATSPPPPLESVSVWVIDDGGFELLVVVVGALPLLLLVAGAGEKFDWPNTFLFGAVGARLLTGRNEGGLIGELVVMGSRVVGASVSIGAGVVGARVVGAKVVGGVVMGATVTGAFVTGALVTAAVGRTTGCGRTTSNMLDDVPVGLLLGAATGAMVTGAIVTGGAVRGPALVVGTVIGGGGSAPACSTAGPDNSVKPLS